MRRLNELYIALKSTVSTQWTLKTTFGENGLYYKIINTQYYQWYYGKQ